MSKSKLRQILAEISERESWLVAATEVLRGELKLLHAELKDDGICGRWRGDMGAVTIYKSVPGYIVTFFEDERITHQAWIVKEGDRLNLHDSHGRCAECVSHFASSELLVLGSCGTYIRDSRSARIVFP